MDKNMTVYFVGGDSVKFGMSSESYEEFREWFKCNTRDVYTKISSQGKEIMIKKDKINYTEAVDMK